MGKNPPRETRWRWRKHRKKCSASLLGTLVRKVTSLPVPFRLQSRLRGRRSFLRAKLPTSVTRGWHLIPETSPNTFTNILAPNEIIIIVSWESAPWKTPFSPPCHHRLAHKPFVFDSILLLKAISLLSFLFFDFHSGKPAGKIYIKRKSAPKRSSP